MEKKFFELIIPPNKSKLSSKDYLLLKLFKIILIPVFNRKFLF